MIGMQMKSIAVYCGASNGAKPIYAEAARLLARALVEHNIALVYGGGKVGLMGVIADEVLRLGGEATGLCAPPGTGRLRAHGARGPDEHRCRCRGAGEAPAGAGRTGRVT